jgi:hypothetical protein
MEKSAEKPDVRIDVGTRVVEIAVSLTGIRTIAVIAATGEHSIRR